MNQESSAGSSSADNAENVDNASSEPQFVVLAAGRLPALKEQLATLQGAGFTAQIVHPPDQAANG
ncbi:MAG: hypothetical protein AAF581_14330 [Planctomycetota bacterium]